MKNQDRNENAADARRSSSTDLFSVWERIRLASIKHVGVEIDEPYEMTETDIRETVTNFHDGQINEIHRALHNFEREVKALLSENVERSREG